MAEKFEFESISVNCHADATCEFKGVVIGWSMLFSGSTKFYNDD